MTTPWKYTGQSVPRAKQAAGTAALEHPARVVADLVTTSTPSRKIKKDAQTEKASAHTTAGFKERATKGGTPKQLWPSTDGSVERQNEVHSANTPVRIKAEGTKSRASGHNTRFQTTLGQDEEALHKAEPSGNAHVHARTRRTLQSTQRRPIAPPSMVNVWLNKGGATMARLLKLASNAGLVMGSTLMLKQLLLPKTHVHMPDIIRWIKALMLAVRTAVMRSAEHGARLAGAYPKTASAYAMVMLAASASRMLKELSLLAHFIVHAGTAILGMHGISMNGTNHDLDDDAGCSSSAPSSQVTSDEEEPIAEERDAAATGTDGTDDDDEESTNYKDFTTFWETRPTREMSKQLSSQEIDVYKTDLNVATLEDWKLKVLTFMRRRYPQFGALLQLAWTEENNERLLEIISDNEYAATANVWGASALLALIEVTKPKGKVFEHELL